MISGEPPGACAEPLMDASWCGCRTGLRVSLCPNLSAPEPGLGVVGDRLPGILLSSIWRCLCTCPGLGLEKRQDRGPCCQLPPVAAKVTSSITAPPPACWPSSWSAWPPALLSAFPPPSRHLFACLSQECAQAVKAGWGAWLTGNGAWQVLHEQPWGWPTVSV